MASVETASASKGASLVPSSLSDERRAKAMEEHRRLVREHRDKEAKLRECTGARLLRLATINHSYHYDYYYY